jgi:hypothetical protein
MAYERLKNATLPRAVPEVVAALADLVQKEVRLAKAELSAKLGRKLQAGIWMSAAGILGLIGGVFLMQGLAFAIASYGIAMHWACLIVAGILVIGSGLAFLKGHANAQEELTPVRTIHQIKRDISIVKEQLT